MKVDDEFYIGWEDRLPPRAAARIRRTIILLLAIAVLLGVLLSVAQRTVGGSVFEWGKIKSFSGILRSQPYPHLLVPRPGASAGQVAFSSYYLVNPFKFGLDAETTRRLDGHSVQVQGTLIHRGNQTMIEVLNNSLQPLDRPAHDNSFRPLPDIPQSIQLGQQTLVGEIVDSKCYLGVMNPGALLPHRACAIRCISGGIPPVLLVRQANGPPLYLLLVSPQGKPVNQQVLTLVAEPVEITGEVERQGELLILRADPAKYRRVRH